jgi:hypothetical protein
MGREGILYLGLFAVMWTWVAFSHATPDRTWTFTALCGIPQAALAIGLYVKCRER